MRTPGQVLVAMVDSFGSGDLDHVDDLVDPAYLDHQGLWDERPIRGRDGFARVVRTARAAYATLDVRIEDLVEGDDRAVARISWTGTTADGEVVRRETIDIVRSEHGRAVEHWGARGD